MKISYFVLFFSILLIILFPATYIYLKVISIIIFAVFIAAKLSMNSLNATQGMCVAIIIPVIIGLALILYSAISKSSGNIFFGMQIFVINVFIYGVICLAISNYNNADNLLIDSLFASSLIISINIFCYLFSNILGLNYPLGFLELDYKFGMSSTGLFAYSTNNLPVLMFTIPFMLTFFALGRNSLKKWHTFSLFISLTMALVSLRLALWLVIIFPILFLSLFSARIRFYLILFLLIASPFIYFLIMDGSVLNYLYDLKFSGKLEGNDQRFMQTNFWLEKIMEKPIFGHGIGSIDISGGNISNPYGYELTFLMLLTQLGIFFSFIYTIMFFIILLNLYWVATKSFEHSKNRVMAIGLALGSLMFLLASYTNGYLLTFGYMWIIFFPLAFIWWRKFRIMKC